MLTVLASGIWQLSSVVLESEGCAVIVDPAYFPRELDALASLVASSGRAVSVVFTHSHWDHIVGWQTFPEAEVWTHASLAEAIAARSPEAEASFSKARDFDARWYVERIPPLAFPPSARALRDGEELRVGALTITAMTLPGHSADGLGLLVHEEGALLVGDHLSPCEIPFVEDLVAYRATLLRLLDVMDTCSRVVPGHGPSLSREQARAIAREDLVYLDALARAADRGDREGARAILLPRAANVPGMREHHLENCRAAGLG